MKVMAALCVAFGVGMVFTPAVIFLWIAVDHRRVRKESEENAKLQQDIG